MAEERRLRALRDNRHLARFIITGVPTGKQLGTGSYGSVEEVCACKANHIYYVFDSVCYFNVVQGGIANYLLSQLGDICSGLYIKLAGLVFSRIRSQGHGGRKHCMKSFGGR